MNISEKNKDMRTVVRLLWMFKDKIMKIRINMEVMDMNKSKCILFGG